MKLKGATMKTVTRPLFVALIAALAAIVFTAVAVAAARDNQHPQLMPDRLIGVPELSAVVWSSSANSFIQFMFDRGKVTAVSASASGGTVTIKQGTGANIWRTQSFTIPASATVRLNTGAGAAAGGTSAAVDRWRKVTIAQLKVGMRARIVQTGPVGGSLQIVRVDASRADRDVPLPAAAG
jgi:hypothetical protein